MKLFFIRLVGVLFASLCTVACGSSDGGGGGGNGGGTRTFPSQPVWQPTGNRVTWSGFSFIVPQGMTGTDQTDRYDISDDKCLIIVVKPMPATGDLAQQANDLLTSEFGALGFQLSDDYDGTDFIGNRSQGRSSGGWEYVELKAALREPSGQLDARGHLLLVRNGHQVVPFFGFSPTNTGCTQLVSDNRGGIVGEQRWRDLEFSLEFPGAARDERALAAAVLGQWSYFEGPSAQEYVFAANGRYQRWSGLGTVHQISSTEIAVVSSAWLGDGAYEVKGDLIAVFPDGSEAESMFFRVYEKHATKALVVTSPQRLGLMKKVAGVAYEVPLERVK